MAKTEAQAQAEGLGPNPVTVAFPRAVACSWQVATLQWTVVVMF